MVVAVLYQMEMHSSNASLRQVDRGIFCGRVDETANVIARQQAVMRSRGIARTDDGGVPQILGNRFFQHPTGGLVAIHYGVSPSIQPNGPGAIQPANGTGSPSLGGLSK